MRTQSEKDAAMCEMSRELNRLFQEIVAENPDILPQRRPGSLEFNLKRGQRMYLYWSHRRTRYCYTPHPDVDGNYWYFDGVRDYYNPKAKPGQLIESFKRKRLVKCARRKTAKNGAWRRYQGAIKRTNAHDRNGPFPLGVEETPELGD